MADRMTPNSFPVSAREKAEEGVATMLTELGFDLAQDGLRGTPRRVVAALREMTSGYDMDPKKILSVNFDGEKYDEIVSLGGIPFSSLCEHHLLPFIGVAGIAYLPDGNRVVGLSKLARIVDVYSKRLQIQEQMTTQIAGAIDKYLKPLGVMVIIEAEHQCMACRGVMKPGAVMRTASVSGVFAKDPSAKSEALDYLRRR